MQIINISSTKRDQFIDITRDIQKYLTESGVTNGICTVFVPHTTAGITINENADPDVLKDMINFLDQSIPWQNNYRHLEGNSAAHIKASYFGSSVTVIINEGKLQLGTWQSIFFAEFDGPRSRKIFLNVISNH